MGALSLTLWLGDLVLVQAFIPSKHGMVAVDNLPIYESHASSPVKGAVQHVRPQGEGIAHATGIMQAA